MSWSKALFFICMGASLVGCGFRPLYGTHNDRLVERELAIMKIEPVEGRLGQMLHNELLTLANPKGRSAANKYTLKVRLSASKSGLSVAKTKFATRSNYQLNGTYSVFDHILDKSVFTDSFSVISSYNSLKSEFGTLMAEKDAKRRVTTEGAREIYTQLSVFFAQKRNGHATGTP